MGCSKDSYRHGLRTPGEEIAFTARPKIKSQSQIYRYSRSIFCLPHRPKISAFFDLCLHWVSLVRSLEDNQDYSHTSSSSLCLPREDIIFCIVAWSRIWKWEKLKLHILLKKTLILSYLYPATEIFYHWFDCYYFSFRLSTTSAYSTSWSTTATSVVWSSCSGYVTGLSSSFTAAFTWRTE